MIGTLADAETKIRACKQQLQEIKGVQRCPNCGTEVSNGSAFCSACGASLPKVQPPEPAGFVKCPHCGASVKSGMRFCTSCGKPMEAAASPAPKEPDSAEEPLEETTPAEQTCPNCGEKVAAEMAFCPECGCGMTR